MKKLLALAFAAALAVPAFAAEANNNSPAGDSAAVWPAVFAFSEWPETPDLIGLRLTIPFSTRQECVTGIDLGLWGRSKDFEGVGVSILRNDVKDTFAGLQVGLYNTVNFADLFSIQAGLVNEAQSFRGIQAGIVNLTGDAEGLQAGLINRAESLYGIQVGLINVIRASEVPMMLGVNIGF